MRKRNTFITFPLLDVTCHIRLTNVSNNNGYRYFAYCCPAYSLSKTLSTFFSHGILLSCRPKLPSHFSKIPRCKTYVFGRLITCPTCGRFLILTVEESSLFFLLSVHNLYVVSKSI